MGYRLHYAATYKVKYEGGYFNYKTEINQLLAEKCDAWCSDECPEHSDRLEVYREDLRNLVKEMREDPEQYQKYLDSKNWDYTLDDFIAIFKEMIEKSDQDNNYIVLKWF